jgi:integrase
MPKSKRSVGDDARWGRLQNFYEQINSDAFDERGGVFPCAHLHHISNEPGHSFGNNDIRRRPPDVLGAAPQDRRHRDPQVGAATQQGYIRSFEEVRRFQLLLAENGAQIPILNHTVAALRFFFRVRLKCSDIVEHTTFIHEPRKLPVVLGPDEVARLLDAAPGLKYKAALSVAYGAGLRVSEVVALKVSDIDSKRMVIRVEQG